MFKILPMEDKLLEDVRFAIEQAFGGKRISIFKRENANIIHLFAINIDTEETVLSAILTFSVSGCDIDFIEASIEKEKSSSFLHINFNDYKKVKQLETVIQKVLKK